MISAVVFKGGTPYGRALSEVLSSLEPVQVRGLGTLYRYVARRKSLYFISVEYEPSFNFEALERRIFYSLGRPSLVVVLHPPEDDRIFLHATGNVTTTNPFLHPSYSPRSLSPTDPDFLGTLYLALRKLSTPVSIVAVHDPPSNSSSPTIAARVPEMLMEEFVPALLASFRKRKMFIPYITVSSSYRADYFDKLFLRRRISAYHIPYYWVHYLDLGIFSQAVEKSGVRKVLVQKGLELPGELPQEEV